MDFFVRAMCFLGWGALLVLGPVSLADVRVLLLRVVYLLDNVGE